MWETRYKDHPRLCGEKFWQFPSNPPAWGSPPPMRGKDLLSDTAFFLRRITPAYAGKSDSNIFSIIRFRDHPRLCGEKADRCRGRTHRAGITPAYAGKRLARVFVHFASRDHPRLCGEKLLLCEHCGKPIGSPPPMRGKDRPRRRSDRPPGITPAYAGKRQIEHCLFVHIEDHPRLCGEKSVRRPSDHKQPGSPPPMRGKVQAQSR